MKQAAAHPNLRYLVISMFLAAPFILGPASCQLEARANQLKPENRLSQMLNPKTGSTTTTTAQPQAPMPQLASEHNNQSATTSQQPENSWIESILIHVESLNFNNEQLRPAQEEAEEEPGEVLTASGSHALAATPNSISNLQQQQEQPRLVSQAPTDSGEDPLEATTLPSASSSSDRKQSSATQYSIAAGASDLSSSEEAGLVDEEQTLVDSNNVSVALLSSGMEQTSSPISGPNALAEDGHIDSATTPHQQVTCELAYTQCALRKACAPALKAYNDDCQDLINNKTNKCSSKCLKAMIALRSSEEGDVLMNCDCQSQEYCLRSKQRSEVCRPQVEQAVDPKTIVSCSTASWICLADQLCSTALSYYYSNCQSLFSQHYCSMRCNNSLSILYRQPKASKLISCHCDGSEEFPCVKYKTFTERLCLNKLSPSTQTDADELLAAADDSSKEEDESNLTNDPDTFDPGSRSTAFGGASLNEEDEYEDPRVAASSFDDSSAEESVPGSNGIHSNEDNWIPLMSGRYFTNLHQQQRAKQRRQMLLLEKRQQQQQQQQASSQQQRKSTRNLRQKSKSNSTSGYHDARKRHNRILMFASSSSTSLRHSPTRLLAAAFWAAFVITLHVNPDRVFTRLLLH